MSAARECAGEDALVLSALPIVDEATAFVCRRRRCSPDEGEEFRSFVRLKLLERDAAVLRQFTGESSLKSYLSVVVQRLFIDFRRQRWGIWRPSAEARRSGRVAIRLDTLVNRDQVPLDEAIERLRTNEGVTASVAELHAIASRLPRRFPRHAAEGEQAAEPAVSAAVAVERPAFAHLRARRAAALREALREALSRSPDEDALLVRLHFVQGLTIARIALVLGVPQRPLYRRVERLLQSLKAALEEAGFVAGEVAELLGDPVFDEEGDLGTTEQQRA